MPIDLAEGSIFDIAGTGLAMPLTVSGWIRPDAAADTGIPPYRSIWYLGSGSYGNYVALFLTDDPALAGDDAAAPPETLLTSTITIGNWIFFAIVAQTGTNNFRMYWRTPGQTSLTAVTSATWSGTLAVNTLRWGGGPGESAGAFYDGAVAYGRVFLAALTEAQLLAESASTTAIQPAWADWPFSNTTNSTQDVSGNGRHLTLTGTQADTDSLDITLANDTEGTASGTWGGWSGTALGEVEVGVTEGLAGGTWGGWSGFANGEVVEAVTDGTAASSWGGWSGTALGEVVTNEVAGTATGTWGGWVGTALGQVDTTAVDLTIEIGPTRGPGKTIGPTRTGWVVGPTRGNRGA